jgi:hypothetical protein
MQLSLSKMQRHYPTVGLDEKRAAIAGVIRLVPPDTRPAGPREVGVEVGTPRSHLRS